LCASLRGVAISRIEGKSNYMRLKKAPQKSKK